MNAFPHKGLPACQADFVNTKANRDPGQTQNLLIREDILMSQFSNPTIGPAIEATQIASVRDRYAEVVEASIVLID
jgi:hypothetical protein